MDAKTALVTGANGGIGLETARGLARLGYHVILLCRNQGRAAAAKADIDDSVDNASTDVVIADLGLQSDVRRAAVEISNRVGGLDVLVNNAGVYLRSKEKTAEGHDAMLAINHLGPFLLTNLLLGTFKAPARVVTVASEAHKFGSLHLDDLERERRGYGLMGVRRYGETKLMNILFTRELARRVAGTPVTANCVHPGGVATSLGAPPGFLKPILARFLRSPAEGAKTTLRVATDADLASVSGSYFADSRLADDKLSSAARSETNATELWARSVALVGLDEPTPA